MTHEEKEILHVSSCMSICSVATPQHAMSAQLLRSAHIWHDGFNHSDIEYSNEKKCYHIFIQQTGIINKETWHFTSLETAMSAHGICFGSESSYLDAIHNIEKCINAPKNHANNP